MDEHEAYEIAAAVADSALMAAAKAALQSSADWSDIPENYHKIVVACTWDKYTVKKSGWLATPGPRAFTNRR